MKSDRVDMLNGALTANIVRFSLPIVITSVVQQLFNSADTAVIGKFGENGALAAVGTNGEIVAMIVSLSAGLSIGSNVLISKYIGAGKQEKSETAIKTSMIFSLIFGIIFAVIGALSAMPLLKLINTPPDILQNAVKYLRLYCLSIPFLLIYDFAAAAFKAKGDSRTPLTALIFSGAVNVILNLFFVIVCRLNVVGVALATVISTAVSAVITVYRLIRQKDDSGSTSANFDMDCFVQMIRIGLPAALQGAVFCFANIFVQASVNTFGAEASAGSSIAMTFEYFAYYVITSLGQAATTFISQNYAAKKLGRCKKIMRICLFIAFASCAAITVPLTVFSHQASAIFTSNSTEADMSCLRISLILIFEPICAFYEIPASAMRGLGYSAIPAIETIIGICLFRIVWIFTLFRHFNTLQSLYAVFPLTWIVTSAAVAFSYCVIWRKIKNSCQTP